MEQIELNKLPQYTHLINFILNQKNKYKKTESEVLREFDREKWNHLLTNAKKKNKLTRNDVIYAELEKDHQSIYFNKDRGFILDRNEKIIKENIDLYEKVLSKYTNHSSGLVELGAGYGAKLINLASRNFALNLDLYAGEMAKSGVDIIKLFSNKLNLNIKTQLYNFKKSTKQTFFIPENAVIYTSYAMHYIPNIKKEYFYNILDLKPKALIMFEPFYEHHDMQSLHGLLCRKYIELNDYTMNFQNILNKLKNDRKLKIKITKNVFGTNPFLPLSIIEIVPYV